MTVEEVFELWKKETYKGNLCEWGQVTGYFCGYYGFESCKAFSDVRYGRAQCPSNCECFKMKSDSDLWKVFLIYYHNAPSYYNEKYNIDTKDPNYYSSMESQKQINSFSLTELITYQEIPLDVIPEVEDKFEDD